MNDTTLNSKDSTLPKIESSAQSQYNEISSNDKEFVCQLTSEESRIYSSIMNCITTSDNSSLRVSGLHDSRILAEPFQKAWRKVNSNDDYLRYNFLSKKIKRLLINEIPSRTGTHPGFDDVVLGVDRKGKYVLAVIELKTNKIGSVASRLNKGTEATKFIARKIKKQSDDFSRMLFEDGVSLETSQKIANSLFKRSRLSANAIGLDFQRKAADKSLVLHLKLVLNDNEANKILEAAIKQNMLLSIIKTGYAFSIRKVNGFFTVKKDNQKDVVDCLTLKFKIKYGKTVDIKIKGDMFKLDYDSETKQLSTFNIPVLDKSLSADELKAYNKIKKLIGRKLKKIDLSVLDKNNSFLSSFDLTTKINKIQTIIYESLINSKFFAEFQIFHNGTMFFCLETMSGSLNGEKIKRYLQNYSAKTGIRNYHYHQEWIVPFGKELNKVFWGIN